MSAGAIWTWKHKRQGWHGACACAAGLAIAALGYGCRTAPRGAEGDGALSLAATPSPTGVRAPGGFVHGFRHDPVAGARADTSLQGALVRTLILDEPKAGDVLAIENRIAEILNTQLPDGSFPDPTEQGPGAATGAAVLELLELGCPADRPALKGAAASLLAAAEGLPRDRSDSLSCHAVRALCLLNMTGHPAVKNALRRLAANMDTLPAPGRPWNPAPQLDALWAGRAVAEVDAAIVKGLTWLEANLPPTGCNGTLGLCEPWSLVRTAGTIEHPLAQRVAARLVPALLRLQSEDGGWGGYEHRTLRALRMLKRHGLLDPLMSLPPLPPDWRVVRAVPVPAENPGNIVWLNGRLWVLDRKSWTALAVSPEDGKLLARTALPRKPGMFTIGAWGSSFSITAGGENRRLYRVNPASGQIEMEIALDFMSAQVMTPAEVDGKLVVGDGIEGTLWVIDPAVSATAPPAAVRIAAGMPVYICGAGADAWAVDFWAPVLVRTNLKGELLDWGERPFGRSGIAWDGHRLWALDREGKRICAIEKTDSGAQLMAMRFEAEPEETAEEPDTGIEEGEDEAPIDIAEQPEQTAPTPQPLPEPAPERAQPPAAEPEAEEPPIEIAEPVADHAEAEPAEAEGEPAVEQSLTPPMEEPEEVEEPEPEPEPDMVAIPPDEAERFLDLYRRVRCNEADRQMVADQALLIADEFAGSDTGVEALMLAARTYEGYCQGRPLGAEGWDKAIGLYRRLIKEYPGTVHALNAGWRLATCTGAWGRPDCCAFNMGKKDWTAAIRLYEALYAGAADPGSRCAALRHICEIQWYGLEDWQGGLRTYGRILAEFPRTPPPSPFEVWRTCSVFQGAENMEHEAAHEVFGRLVRDATSARQAIRLREQFVKLAPALDSLRFHTWLLLGERLTQLGESERAAEIDTRLGLCRSWLVVGPFVAGESGALPPEQDVLAGRLDLARLYPAATGGGLAGKAAWVPVEGLYPQQVWRWPNDLQAEAAFCALVRIDSPAARPAQLRFGATGRVKAWLDGRELFDADLGWSVVDKVTCPVELKAGANLLFLRFAELDRCLGKYLRVTDADGKALADVSYTTPDVPPENWSHGDFLPEPPPPKPKEELQPAEEPPQQEEEEEEAALPEQEPPPADLPQEVKAEAPAAEAVVSPRALVAAARNTARTLAVEPSSPGQTDPSPVAEKEELEPPPDESATTPPRAAAPLAGLCRNWLVIGPFHKAGTEPGSVDALRAVYGPESDYVLGRIKPAETYEASTHDGRTGKALWVPWAEESEVVAISLPGEGIWTADGCCYALTFLNSPSERPAVLRVSAPCSVKAWFNGQEEIAAYERAAAAPGFAATDEQVTRVVLREGRNTVLVKLVLTNPYQASFVQITDSAGAAMPDVVAAPPDAPPENRAQADFLVPR